MSFIEPLFLAGLLAAAIPIVVHLINRRKATRQSFPAMRLLQESNKKEASSIKVRQFLLLSLRVLVIAALAFALAKPYFLSDEGVTASERLPTAVAFVVDDSASMQHADWWPKAVGHFEDEMGGLRPWDEAALITATAPDGPMTRFSDNHGDVNKAFEKLGPTDASADLSEAIEAAGDLLSGSQLPSKRIVVISDFARGGFPAKPTVETKIPYEIRQVPVRSDRATIPDNLSVTAVDYQQEHSGRGGAWEINATVQNWGAEDQKGVQLRLNIDGEDIGGGLVDVPAGKKATHTFRHHFEGSGVRHAYVELVDADRLAVDNRHHFSVDLKERIRVLVVNGEPSGVAYNDETYFLARALNPGSRSQSTILPEVVSGERLERQDLGSYDVVILANMSSVSDSEAAKLESFVDGGGGLMLTMGDQVDTSTWNRTMGNLLPKPLRGLKRLAERDDPDAPVKITQLGSGNREHPVFRIFDMPGGAALQSVNVFSYMLLEPAQPAQSREILTYKDGAPALLERKVGDGRVVLLTTTIDREWSDLPVRTVFLPLMRRNMEFLARRATSAGKDRPVVGKPVTMDVSGLVDERAIVRGPDQKRVVLEPNDSTVTITPDRVGHYEVWADSDESRRDSEKPRNRLDALSFAANVDADESQLEALGEDVFEPWTAQADGDEAEGKGEAAEIKDERRVNVWPPILFVVTIFLLLETILGTRRSVLARVWRRMTFQKEPEVDV
ncbi:MAG: BatA domain-containing protein [Persicimonas sp.]